MKKEYFGLITQRWKKEYTLSFFSTFIIGLLVHFYKFTNYLPNHDSMYSFYNNQNVLESGRWLLSIACGFSSYYDLPWINGLFSLFFIATTSVIIVRVFEIANPIVVFILSCFMTTFPSVTEILCFEFTADGFFLSMLLSALAGYVLITVKNKWICMSITSLLICFSCGIYQAYLSFTIVMIICWLIWKLLTVDKRIRVYAPVVIKLLLSIALGLVAYCVIWKVCLTVQGVVPTNNQGISEIGVWSFDGFISSLKKVAQAIVGFVIEKNIFKHGIGFYAILNIIFLSASSVIFVIAIVKSKTFKRISKIIVIILCVIILPFVICIWQFASPGVSYGIRMMHSLVVVYMLPILLCEKYLKELNSILVATLCVVMTINFAVRSNIAYYYLNFEYENTYAEAVSLEYGIKQAMHQYGENHVIALIGSRDREVALNQNTEANGIFAFSSMIEKSLLLDSNHTENFLKNVLYFEGSFANNSKKAEISETEQFNEMKSWFDGGDIELINDTITVKLG